MSGFKFIRTALVLVLALSFIAVTASCICITDRQDTEINLAPIHDVRINIAESFPEQIFVYIKGGLRDSCTTFHDIETQINGNTIDITVTTERPKDEACAQVYNYFEKNVALGSDFVRGETYIVNVNDVTTSFEYPSFLSAPSHADSSIISMDILHMMGGSSDYLAIYEDGYVLRYEEINKRMSIPETNPPTRHWYADQLSDEELANLTVFFQSSSFSTMDDNYTFPGKTLDNGAFSFGDSFFTVSLDYGDLQKEVTASSYLEYEDMPPPLNEIYDRLWDIAIGTNFIFSEIIPD